MPLNREILQPYKKKIFVETGTRFGEGVQLALDVGFEKIYSIEINDDYFKRSSERFRNNEKVNLIKGDSREEFSKILRQIQEPATIWLDAHTPSNAPIMEELKALQQHPIKNHIILIDDVRDIENIYFLDINNLTKEIKKINPKYDITVINNTHYPNNKLLVAHEKRIMYIDYFDYTNSNPYWLKAFKKFGLVETFEITGNKSLLKEKIMNFKPHHIHLGGSVKVNMVPPELLSDIKRKFGCTISVFYGDTLFSQYHSELSKVVDYIYITNKIHIKINEEKGLMNFEYMPCPTDPEVWKHYKSQKIYDVVFIGNHNQVSRLPLLKKLSKEFNLKVFGFGWENTGLDFGQPAFGEEFSKVCSKAKISVGIVDNKWVNLEANFSNRLINTLATGSFFITRYIPGLENIFTNKKHLVWYNGEDELIELIKYYLINEKEREEIAIEGQKEVYKKYTYEKSVRRILQRK